MHLLRTVVLAGTAVILGGASLQVNAEAATLPAYDHFHGHQSNGNGSYNRISSPANSPNFNTGIQHIINANSGGNTVVQASVCKRRHYCWVSQRSYVHGW